MNPFAGWTKDQVDQHNARVAASKPRSSEPPDVAKLPAKPATFDLHYTTDEAKLNKLERRFLLHIQQLVRPSYYHVQAVTLKLAHDCRLTVDFVYPTNAGRLLFVDVKGFQREDALIKMKVAARLFPEFDFAIVKRTSSGWQFKPVAP